MKKVLLLLSLFLQLFALNISKAQSTFTGVTVITHGFSPGSKNTDTPNWMVEQARAILVRNGGGYIFKSDPQTGLWIPFEVQGTTAASRTHIVLLYNWLFSSWQPVDGNLEAASDNLFGMLMSCPLIPKDTFWGSTINKHFIGHSRGGVLMIQLFHRVLKANPAWKIDHYTSLDPHPATPMLDHNLPYVSPDGDRYKLQLPANVLKADNYYRTDSFYEIGADLGAFDGVNVVGSKTIKLNNSVLNDISVGYLGGGAHSNVHMWYGGTTNTSADFYDGNVLPSWNWYGGSGNWFDLNSFGTGAAPRSELGFRYSYVGGWFNNLGNATNQITWSSTPPRIFNGNFLYSDAKSGTKNYGSTSWNANGGVQNKVDIINGEATIKPSGELKHSFLLIPQSADTLVIHAKPHAWENYSTPPFFSVKFFKFDFKQESVAFPSFGVDIKNIGGTRFFITGNYETFKIPIPSSLKGKSGTFSIKWQGIVGGNIKVDNIYFINSSGSQLRVSNQLNTNSVGSTYFDFPVVYDVNPNPLIKGTQPTSFNATVTNSLSTTWTGTLTMTWRNVNDTGRGIQLATQNVTLAPNTSVTLDRGTQLIISNEGEYVLSVYANNDTAPIDNYYYYVNEPPVIPSTVINIETPTSVSFGSVNVGGSFDKIITIKNASTSNAVLTGTVTPVSGVDMSIISGSQTLNLAPNQSQDITVRFSPLSGGVYNNSLSISGNFNGTSKSISLNGTGVTVLPTLTYSRAAGQTYSLLDAQMGNFSDAIISVSNYSSTAFSGSFAVTGNGYSGFIIGVSGSNLSIPAGGSQNITVRFTPTANGVSTGSLRITGSATNTPAIFNFSTLGTGFPTSGCVTSTTINITSNVNISTPGWREFGRFTLTNTSSSLPANISNFQAGPSDFFRIAGYQQNAQFSLNPNESREFVVEISPISTQAYYSGVIGLNTPIQSCNSLRIQLKGTPAVSTLNPPPLVTPVANEVLPYRGIDYTLNLGIKQGNIFGIARYKYFLIDMTSNQVILDNFDRGVFTSGNPETIRGFTVPIPGVTNPVAPEQQYKVVTGHRYSWKVRAESVSDPNVYADSELRYFSAQQPSICYAPSDFSITNITKNSALVTWNPIPTIYQNPPRYRVLTSIDNGITYNSVSDDPGTSFLINGLLNSQNYKIKIQTVCIGGVPVTEFSRSQLSTDKSFTTLADCSTLTSAITPNTTQIICQGSSVNLTSSVGSSYKWYKDDVLITGATNQIYLAGQAGNYKVKVTYSNGCEVLSNAVSISEITKPNVLISSNYTGICPNASVNLSASQISGTTYQWVKDGVNIPTANSNSYSATSSGIYKLAYTQNGCTFTTDLLNLPLLPAPSIYISGNNDLTVGNTLNLSAFGANTYSWSGSNFSSTANQIIIPNMQTVNAGNYSVVGTGTNGCTSSVNFTITVSPATCTQMYTLKTGNWNDATVWSCGRVPTSTDVLTVKANHFITIPASYTANAKSVIFEAVGGKFIYTANTSKLCLSCP